MRRAVFNRILLVFLVSFFAFWLGTKQSCRSSIGGKVLLRQEESSSNPIRDNAQTAKFNRNARLYALKNKCCEERSPLRTLSKRAAHNLFRHVIVDKKYKFLYCYVPKVASSNMKRLVLTLQGMSENSNAIKSFDQRGFDFLADFTAPEREHMIKTFYKFVFVRDPFTRLVSAYRNKFQTPNTEFHVSYGQKIVRQYRKNASSGATDGHDVTFQEFVRYILDENGPEMNEHWMSVYDICQPCLIPYDFIGSFEFLNLDTKALLEQLNVPKGISFPKKQAFYQAALNRDSVDVFYRNISTEQYRALHGKYMNDFKCFGYRFKHKFRNL